ncbi:MAG TPA: hypothetical protein P5534_16115, partial [Candidatus Paceibacterota bacterium]|nr:hypothetical protein [Candidatus Paceibacterota bacterium]
MPARWVAQSSQSWLTEPSNKRAGNASSSPWTASGQRITRHRTFHSASASLAPGIGVQSNDSSAPEWCRSVILRDAARPRSAAGASAVKTWTPTESPARPPAIVTPKPRQSRKAELPLNGSSSSATHTSKRDGARRQASQPAGSSARVGTPPRTRR